MHELSTQPGINGKGDKPRFKLSDEWRTNYDEAFPPAKREKLKDGKFKKVYR